ncbi:MAG: hypothetical protein LBK07_02380 [Tannerella sp.]|jgi:hypothetical protein|nr:hypothetical protein [Tannerella sp.]
MKKTKQITGKRLLAAWFLMAVFLAPQVAKPLHAGHHECEDAKCAHSSCNDDCPVCHFTLSLFVEAETFDCGVVPSLSVREPAVYPVKTVLPSVPPRHLRGPPHA